MTQPFKTCLIHYGCNQTTNQPVPHKKLIQSVNAFKNRGKSLRLYISACVEFQQLAYQLFMYEIYFKFNLNISVETQIIFPFWQTSILMNNFTISAMRGKINCVEMFCIDFSSVKIYTHFHARN